jgi:hypothetical protein
MAGSNRVGLFVGWRSATPLNLQLDWSNIDLSQPCRTMTVRLNGSNEPILNGGLQ